MHMRADTRLVEQIDSYLFDDASADAAKNIFGGLPLKNDVIDAMLVEELTEQQSRRAGAYDSDLCSHVFISTV